MKRITAVLVFCWGLLVSGYAAEHQVILDGSTNAFMIDAGRVNPEQKIDVKLTLVNPSNNDRSLKFKGSCICMMTQKLSRIAAKSEAPAIITLSAPYAVGKYQIDGLFEEDNPTNADVGRAGIFPVKFVLDVFDGIQTTPNAIDANNLTQDEFPAPLPIGDINILLADPAVDPSTVKIASHDAYLKYDLKNVDSNRFVARFQLFGKHLTPGSYRSDVVISGTGPLINYRKKVPVSYFINMGWEPYPRSVVLNGANPAQSAFTIRIKVPPDSLSKNLPPSLKYSDELRVTIERAGSSEWLLRGTLRGMPQERYTRLKIELNDADGHIRLQIPVYCVSSSKFPSCNAAAKADR